MTRFRPILIEILKCRCSFLPSVNALKRAFKAWFTRAQKPAKLIDDDFGGDRSPEEMEPMLSERIEKWSKELQNKGKAEGLRFAAENLLRKGMAPQEISEITGLSEDVVLEIRESILGEKQE